MSGPVNNFIGNQNNPGFHSITVPQDFATFIEDICIEVAIEHMNLEDLRLELSFLSIQQAEIDMEIFDQPEGQTDNLAGTTLLQFSRYPQDTNALTIGIADGEPLDGRFFAGNLTMVLGNLNAGTWTINVFDLENNAIDGALTQFNLFFNDPAAVQCEQSQAPSTSPSAAPSQAPSSSPTEQSPVATPNTWFLVGALTLAPFLAFVAGLLRPVIAAVDH